MRTDHSSLRWLTNFKEPQGQLTRWLEQLRDMEIIHRPGRLHGIADTLSRMPIRAACSQMGIHLKSLPCGGCSHYQRIQRNWRRFQEDVGDVVPLSSTSVGVQANLLSNDIRDQPVRLDNSRREQKKDSNLVSMMMWMQEGSPDESTLASAGPELKIYMDES